VRVFSSLSPTDSDCIHISINCSWNWRELDATYDVVCNPAQQRIQYFRRFFVALEQVSIILSSGLRHRSTTLRGCKACFNWHILFGMPAVVVRWRRLLLCTRRDSHKRSQISERKCLAGIKVEYILCRCWKVRSHVNCLFRKVLQLSWQLGGSCS
jgi:hypothetical protein